MAQQHIMLDLETFGKSNTAAIVSIGAVKFVPEHRLVVDKFYVVVDPRSSSRFGDIGADTVLWWMHKDRTVTREQMINAPMVDLPSALEGFAMWYGNDKFVPVWGNGSTFDNAILQNAFEKCNMEVPWSYKSDRCYRTLFNIGHAVPFERVGEHHNAVDDALAQAKHLMKIGNKLNIKFK